MEDFFVREPLVLATRGERGVDPVVGLWQPQIGDKDTDDGKDDRGEYVCIGYLLFECSDEDEPLITRVEYVEELDGDVLVEEPDDAVEIIDWEIVDDWPPAPVPEGACRSAAYGRPVPAFTTTEVVVSSTVMMVRSGVAVIHVVVRKSSLSSRSAGSSCESA